MKLVGAAEGRGNFFSREVKIDSSCIFWHRHRYLRNTRFVPFQMLIIYTHMSYVYVFLVASIVPWVLLHVYTIGTRVNRAAHMTMQKHVHLQPGRRMAVYHYGITNHTTPWQRLVYSNNKTQMFSAVLCCVRIVL